MRPNDSMLFGRISVFMGQPRVNLARSADGSFRQIDLLSGYLDDWENISFEDKRKVTDGLISSISATSEYVKIEWKI